MGQRDGSSQSDHNAARGPLEQALLKIQEVERGGWWNLDLSDLSLGAAPLETWAGWEALGRLAHLNTLDLSRNQLTAIPKVGWEALGRLAKLQVLYLYDNQISEIPVGGWEVLARLPDLWFLSLGANKISKIPPEGWESLGRITKLQALYLDTNQIREIPAMGWQALGRLRALEVLDLSNNQLSEIPSQRWESLGHLTRLTKLALAGNPLPEEILAAARRSSTSLFKYINATYLRAAHPRTVKLMLLGEPASGKTTLVEALSGNPTPCDPERSETVGVNVQRIEKKSSLDGGPLYLATWDFAGQQMEFATHQFFLKPGGVCLILWKARLGSDYGQRDLWYWLELLKMRVKDPEFLLVTTHTRNTPAALDLTEVQASYPGCKGHFEVELSDLTGVAALEQRILELASASPAMKAAWPAPWLAVRDAIRRTRDETPYISSGAFWKLCAEKEVEARLQCDLADQLDRLGEIVYYADEPLSRLVILDPTWVTELVAKVVRDKQVRDRGGTLTSADLDRIWGDLPSNVRDHLENLMDEYDLVYRTPMHHHARSSIVVEALPPAPEEVRNRDFAAGRPQTEMIYRFPTLLRHLPPGVPTWAFARSHRYMKKDAGPWRNAGWFEDADTNSEAMVFSSEVDREVRVRVAADYPPYFFGVLDGILRDTFKRYPGAQPESRIPCPCKPGCKHSHPRETVLKRKRDGKTDISCPLSGDDVALAKLLEGFTPGDTQAGLLASLAEMRRQLSAIQNGQNEDLIKTCPSMFTLAPSRDFRLLDTYLEYATQKEELELMLYCEWEKEWHPTPQSVYRFRPEQEWFDSLKKNWTTFVKLTKRVAPLAGVGGAELVEKADKIVGEVTSSRSGVYAEELGLREQAGMIDLEARHILASLIKSLDKGRGPTQPEFGGLHPYHLKEDGRLLWLCAEHRGLYERNR